MTFDLLIKEIQMREGTSERIVRVCCDYFKQLKKFIAVEQRNGLWYITVSFEDELDYLAFITKKMTPITPI